MLERRTVPHDLLEVQIATDFFFEIYLLLRKLLFQFGNLAEGEAILYSDGDLTGCLLEKLDLIRQEGIIGAPVNGQNSDGSTAAYKRYHALSLQPLSHHQFI